MSSVSASYTYSIEDINGTIRSTNNLLRSVNALRVTFKDLQEVARKPTAANIFWTLIQISRIYTSLRRLNKDILDEAKQSREFMKLLRGIRYVEPPSIPTITVPSEPFGFSALSLNVQAYRENLSMRLEGVDLSNLPDETREKLQWVVEDDADMTVQDARSILRSRIIHPAESTGNLEQSIGWTKQVDGVLISADMPYAWWVEEGQRTFTGHHYLRDAVAMSRQRLPLRIKAELNALISNRTQ